MDTTKALEILGLGPNPSLGEAKKAYREQVKLWHPDRYSNGSAIKKMAEKNIQDANLAFALLKRKLPRSSARPGASTARQPTRPPSGERPPIMPVMHARGLDLLAAVSRMFLKINFRPLLEWLQRGRRNRFRPWYRYPERNDDVRKGAQTTGFEQLLKKALRDPAGIKRIPPTRLSSRSVDEENASAPVKGVSKSTPPPPSGPRGDRSGT